MSTLCKVQIEKRDPVLFPVAWEVARRMSWALCGYFAATALVAVAWSAVVLIAGSAFGIINPGDDLSNVVFDAAEFSFEFCIILSASSFIASFAIKGLGEMAIYFRAQVEQERGIR